MVVFNFSARPPNRTYKGYAARIGYDDEDGMVKLAKLIEVTFRDAARDGRLKQVAKQFAVTEPNVSKP